ncbi:site-specific integrase [Halomonas sp. ATBC28]|uniref:site-specific integrase n=1 Tax=Halomonas sp. ATBC28 TaxID=2545264 RepID=UPI001BB2A3B4|nr:site-specific integrase [Halomonas sp. ATBC28]
MTALREKMIAAMRQRGFAQRTHNTYLMVVTDLARYFHRPPDTLSTDDLQHFFNHLVHERGLSAAGCRVYLQGVRFLLQWSSFDVPLTVPKKIAAYSRTSDPRRGSADTVRQPKLQASHDA